MVTMTDTAAKKISELRLEEGKPEWGLRIRIVGGGCSGMSYELARYRPYTLFAVGHEYVTPTHRLRPDDELSLFPPVSGGAGGDTYRVVAAPLSPDAIASAVDDPGAGGIVIFSGVVRNETEGRSVKFLEYEAHAPMAEAKMREIGACASYSRNFTDRPSVSF